MSVLSVLEAPDTKTNSLAIKLFLILTTSCCLSVWTILPYNITTVRSFTFTVPQCLSVSLIGLVRIPFFWASKLRYKSTSNIRSFGGRGLNIFFSLIKAGISVLLSVCLHFYVKNRSSNRLHAWRVCCCDAVSHFGAIWTRATFRINKLLINYRTARAGSGTPHAGRAYMLRERTLH